MTLNPTCDCGHKMKAHAFQGPCKKCDCPSYLKPGEDRPEEPVFASPAVASKIVQGTNSLPPEPPDEIVMTGLTVEIDVERIPTPDGLADALERVANEVRGGAVAGHVKDADGQTAGTWWMDESE